MVARPPESEAIMPRRSLRSRANQLAAEPESEDGNPVDEAAVREVSDRLPQLKAELEELRSRRQLMIPADGR